MMRAFATAGSTLSATFWNAAAGAATDSGSASGPATTSGSASGVARAGSARRTCSAGRAATADHFS